jgi:murein DD-endopeptidase
MNELARAIRSICLVAVLIGISGAKAVAQPATPQNRSAGAPNGIVGTWKGVLGEGADQLHLLLTITRPGAGGEYSGQLNSVDQSAVLPMDAITVNGSAVRFEVRAVGGVYEGTLSADGTHLTGTWTQTGLPPQPLSFERGEASSAPASTTSSGPTEKPLTVPIDVVVPIAPTAFQANGKMHLVYELHVTNMGPWDCTLTRVETVSGNANATSIGVFAEAQLEGMISRPGTHPAAKAKIEPGNMAVVFLWVTVEAERDLPTSIRHRLTVKLGTYPDELTLETNPTPVQGRPIVVTPPLRGDHWVAANGPSNTSGHRRALIPIDGRAMIAQRFAIDWVKLGDNAKTYHDDPKDNRNYYAFGSEALAVADGIVTEVKDGIPLNIPGLTSRAVPITLETVGGNHVIIDIGHGYYAFYAHLQPGSIRVKVGEKVQRGQILGLVGNTGNSTEPHLHFHISTASSPLGSEGLPYELRSFEVEGHGLDWKPSEAKGAPEKHTMEMPLEDSVVRFPPQ